MGEPLPISLCIFVKNEEKSIADCIESVKSFVSEIVVVDTGSTDRTVEIARKYTDLVYYIPFTDFGSIRTITAHLASQPWVLMLDADEAINFEDYDKFSELIDRPVGVAGADMELDEDGDIVTDSYAFPRKRWAGRNMKKQVDVASYPDWQVRLFRNHTNRRKIRFVRRVHETIEGCIRTEHCQDGPTIHHFQNENKDKAALLRRQELYTRLYNEDVAEGIVHEEPPVIDEDKVV